MKCFRFAASLKGEVGFVFAGGNSVDDARKRASKITKNVSGGEPAGYFKEGTAARFVRG